MFNFPIPNGTAQNIYASKPRQTGAYILLEYTIPAECDPNCNIPDCPYLHISVATTDWIYTANPENYANNPKHKFWKTPDHMNVED